MCEKLHLERGNFKKGEGGHPHSTYALRGEGVSCQKRMLAYRGEGRGRNKMYVRRKNNFHGPFILVKSFDKENKKKIIVCLLIMIIMPKDLRKIQLYFSCRFLFVFEIA